MTEKDLRLEYKRETGLNAPTISHFNEIVVGIRNKYEEVVKGPVRDMGENMDDMETCIEEMEATSKFEEYIQWLEEKLCKQ